MSLFLEWLVVLKFVAHMSKNLKVLFLIVCLCARALECSGPWRPVEYDLPTAGITGSCKVTVGC